MFDAEKRSIRILGFWLCAGALGQAQPYVTTAAGGDLRPLSKASDLAVPFGGIARDEAGNTYLCGGRHVIRRLRPDGMVEIVAGTGESDFSSDGGPAIAATLYSPFFYAFVEVTVATVKTARRMTIAVLIREGRAFIIPPGLCETVIA